MAGKRVTKEAKRFGAILRSARIRKGLSQGELALIVKRSGPNISNYENGKDLPRLDTLLDLTRALDLELLAPKTAPRRKQQVVVTGYDLTTQESGPDSVRSSPSPS